MYIKTLNATIKCNNNVLYYYHITYLHNNPLFHKIIINQHSVDNSVVI